LGSFYCFLFTISIVEMVSLWYIFMVAGGFINNRCYFWRISMKKIAITILVFLLIPAVVLSGCAQNTGEKDSSISVICTIFPLYDWTRQIIGDQTESIDLTLLLANKIDLHNYQPSVDDIVKISNCDLFIYVGGESDKWVDDALKQAINTNMVVVNLLEILGDAALVEEIIEGMETDGHDHDDHDDHDDGDEHDDTDEHDEHDGIDEHDDGHDGHEAEFDEHIWLSLRNAQIFSSVIAEALISLDAGNADTYRGNLSAYNEKLSTLDSDFKAAISAAPVKTLLFGDRFPFRYLVYDYGLSYYAAFAGCSAETEASFNTVIFLSEKLDELGLNTVLVTESSDKKIAETIIRESKEDNHQILVLDAIQSVDSNDLATGITYLSIMESNLDILKKALSGQ